MSGLRLLGVKEMAAIIGVEPSTLHRTQCRARLEANGMPAPIMLKPLKWSGPLVDRWITGAPAEPATAVPVDEQGLWRARLNKAYGEAAQ